MSLLTSLVSYWKLDEASGSALDAHGSNNLTESSGTISPATGKINNCRDFELGDTEYFQVASNSTLVTGDIDFTFAGWVQLESKAATSYAFVSKDPSGSGREYEIGWVTGTDRFRFILFDNATGVTATVLNATAAGAPSTGTWYYLVAWHDAAADTMNLQVNNGTAASVSFSGGTYAGTAAFTLGARSNATTFHDGLMDEWGFWKRVLTSDERTALYNGGAGLPYSSFGSSEITVVLTQPSETDTTQPLTAAKLATLTQPSETDTVEPVVRAKSATLTQPAETDTAQTFTHAKALSLQQAVETDLAQAVVVSVPGEIVVGISATGETDLAQAITVRAPIALELGMAAESDSAATLTVFVPGAIEVVLGATGEADIALSMTAVHEGFVLLTGLTIDGMPVFGPVVSDGYPVFTSPPFRTTFDGRFIFEPEAIAIDGYVLAAEFLNFALSLQDVVLVHSGTGPSVPVIGPGLIVVSDAARNGVAVSNAARNRVHIGDSPRGGIVVSDGPHL